MTTGAGMPGDVTGGRPDEDRATRLTRNLNELLQELRVMQTGAQILTGFLLTIPFTQRFREITAYEKWVYLGVLSASVLATALIVAPVAFHRALFRQGEREWIVEAAHRAARYGLTALGLTMAGAMWLVFDVVIGPWAGHLAAGMSVLVFVLLWGILPLGTRRRAR